MWYHWILCYLLDSNWWKVQGWLKYVGPTVISGVQQEFLSLVLVQYGVCNLCDDERVMYSSDSKGAFILSLSIFVEENELLRGFCPFVASPQLTFLDGYVTCPCHLSLALLYAVIRRF